jgi:hypothetical protein
MPTARHAITLPDGRVVTRTSRSRTYSHVIVAEVERWDEPGVWRWYALRWSSSAKAAQAAAAGFDRVPYYRSVQVLELADGAAE